MNNTFTEKLFTDVCNSNDPEIDPFSLISHLVNFHNNHNDKDIVKNFFPGSIGKFLIIGANDGLDHSRCLLEQGWNGVYVEADPFACANLIRSTADYADNVTIINTAVTLNQQIMPFYVNKDSNFSSLVETWGKSHDLHDYTKIYTSTVTVQDIFDCFGYDFNYVQTDVEGYDIQLIESFDWSQLTNCDMICTEAGPAVLKQLCSELDLMITDQTLTNCFYKNKKYIL